MLRVDNAVISLAEDLGRSLADLSIYGGDLGDVLESTFKRMAAAVLEATIQTQVLLPLLKSLGVATGGGGGGGGGSLLGNLFGSFLSAFGGFRETGGAVQRGRSYVVGERGPELFVPNAGGRIINNAASRAALAGGPTEVNVNIEPSPLFIATVQRSTAEAAQNYVKSVQRQRLPAAIGQGR
jgi:phage-related minor tail protein